MTVWLQTKVRERGLGLQPRLYLTLADAAALCGLWRYKSAMHLCFCLWFAFTSGPRPVPWTGPPSWPSDNDKKVQLDHVFFLFVVTQFCCRPVLRCSDHWKPKRRQNWLLTAVTVCNFFVIHLWFWLTRIFFCMKDWNWLSKRWLICNFQ